MASITIRKLSDSTKAKLRMRAALNDHSMEEEARTLLEEGLGSAVPPKKPRSAYAAIRQSLADAGIDGIELEIPQRGPMRELPDFSGPEYRPHDDEKR
ncbi:MAG TPA: hypothetical protein VHZ25_18885 [Acidobacteriaceae bacterium]|jgi:plasmid stability protein|nr:hypothetical protein [Acidobacteriaceae bacterium]